MIKILVYLTGFFISGIAWVLFTIDDYNKKESIVIFLFMGSLSIFGIIIYILVRADELAHKKKEIDC